MGSRTKVWLARGPARFDRAWLGGLSLLAGCELSRPSGAYDASYPNYGDDGALEALFNMDAGGDAGHIVLFPHHDGGSGTGGDGSGGTAGHDGGTPASTDPLLAKLAGTYMFRMDQYSSGSTSGVATLSIKNRLSLLGVMQITVDGSTVKSREYVCHQTYLQACDSGCSSATTDVSPAADAKFAGAPPVDRTLSVDASGTISAPNASAYFGFDSTSNTELPTSTSDSRVWNLDNSGPGEGVLTDFKVEATLGSAECLLNTVQQIQSSWSVTAVRSGGSLVIDGQEGTLTLDGSVINRIGGTGKGFVTSAQCTSTSGSGAPTSEVIRFAKTGNSSCPPVGDFESALPAHAP